jgi:hypothetical protein
MTTNFGKLPLVKMRWLDLRNTRAEGGDECVLVTYRGDAGMVGVRLEGDTVWRRQEQLSQLFGRKRTVIGRLLRKAFGEGELDRESKVQDLHIAGSARPIRVEKPKVLTLFRDAMKGERSRPALVRADSAHTVEVEDPDKVEHEVLRSISTIRRGVSVLAAHTESGR